MIDTHLASFGEEGNGFLYGLTLKTNCTECLTGIILHTGKLTLP